MKQTTFLIICFTIISLNSLQAQSGWVREKGDYFLKQDYLQFNSNRFFNLKGKEVTTSEFHQQTLLFYGEYGLLNRLGFYVSFPFLKWNGYETTETVNGIGDLKIEFKYAINKGDFPIALSVSPEIPTGTSELLAQNKELSFERINLATGDGEFNLWTTIAISHSFKNTNLYSSFYASFNYRTEYRDRNFQNQMEGGLETGIKFFDHLWVIGKLIARDVIGEDPIIADFIRGDGTGYTAYSGLLMYEFKYNWAISTQYFNYTDFIISRKNLYSGGVVSIGIIFKKIGTE